MKHLFTLTREHLNLVDIESGVIGVVVHLLDGEIPSLGRIQTAESVKVFLLRLGGVVGHPRPAHGVDGDGRLGRGAAHVLGAHADLVCQAMSCYSGKGGKNIVGVFFIALLFDS